MGVLDGINLKKSVTFFSFFFELKKIMEQEDKLVERCNCFWGLLTGIGVILTLVAVVITSVFVANQDQVFRLCPLATAEQVVGGTPEPGARIATLVNMDQNAPNIVFTFRPELNMSDLTAVLIRGPIQLLSAQGPIAAALCGYPNTEVPCDTISTPGIITGTDTVVYTGTETMDMRIFIENFRSAPGFFYLEFLTNDRPTSPGAARADIVASCGFA